MQSLLSASFPTVKIIRLRRGQLVPAFNEELIELVTSYHSEEVTN